MKKFKLKWTGSDLAPFFALVSKLGADNVDVVYDSETELLTVYGPGESEAKANGTSFNFVIVCPPAPPEACAGT